MQIGGVFRDIMTTAIETSMTGKEIIDLTKKHTLFEWSAQSKVDPIPVARAKGIYFWTPEGKRFIDFNSQLMSVNIGHGDERVINAIQEQAQTLAYANPFMATELGWGQNLLRLRPEISTPFSLRMVVRKPTRMPSKLLGFLRVGTRSWRGTARIMVRPREVSR